MLMDDFAALTHPAQVRAAVGFNLLGLEICFWLMDF
jgi:hypothetical protein